MSSQSRKPPNRQNTQNHPRACSKHFLRGQAAYLMPPTGSCPLAAFQPAFDRFILCACKAHVFSSPGSPGRNRTMARAKTDSGPLSRREFLGATATAALSAGSLLKTARAQDASESTPWYSIMRRCGQINFNERDPLALDANAWMDYWASLKVDAVLLN